LPFISDEYAGIYIFATYAKLFVSIELW